MLHTAKQLWREEKGLTTLEYALLLALILVVAASAWQSLSQI
jgi:Flp pilus assembly pilin Flp